MQQMMFKEDTMVELIESNGTMTEVFFPANEIFLGTLIHDEWKSNTDIVFPDCSRTYNILKSSLITDDNYKFQNKEILNNP